MANRKVLICDTVDVASLALSEDFEVDYLPKITPEELLEKVANYDAVVVRSRTKIDSNVIERAVRLKLIARPGTGLDNIDLRAANAKGIEVVNSPEALVEAVADEGEREAALAAQVAPRHGQPPAFSPGEPVPR